MTTSTPNPATHTARPVRAARGTERTAKSWQTEAALQYVRKISGSTHPSKANEEAFERAVQEIAHISRHLLEDLVSTAPPKNREIEAEKAKARSQKRFAVA